MNNLVLWLQKNPQFQFIFGIIILIIIIFIAYKAGELITRLRFSKDIKNAREDAVKRSKAVIEGLVSEQMAAYLPGFPCSPADCRFVGKPLDFVAFPGAASDDDIKEILLIEVKTGDSQLTAREKQIRDCVKNGRVRYIEYRL